MRNSRLTLIIFLISGFCFSHHSQAQPSNRQPLRDALLIAENKFNVVFTFADEIVNEIQVAPISRNASLREMLNEISGQTGLLFQTIGNRYIVITRPVEESRRIVCATLLSSETGEPVIGATVQLGKQFTVTSAAGYFELPIQSGEVLIRSLGFETLLLSDKYFKKDCSSLFMKPSYTTLEEVTVNDVIASGIEEKVDGSVTIRPEILGILPGLPQPDALQTLQYMPGVKSVAEAAADINIRGGTNDQNLVLLDGIKVYQTGHFFGLISGINPHVISKINLTRNGTSAYFGESTSGTIHIQSEDRVTNKLSGGGGINLLYTDGHLNVPVSKKMSVQLAARRSLPSGWQTPTYKQYFNRAFSNSEIADANSTVRNQDFYFFDTHVKLLYDVTNRDRVRVTFFNVANQLEFEETAQGANLSEEKKSNLEQHSIGGSLNYSRLWNDKIKTTLEGYVSGYSLDAINQNIAINQQLTQANEVLESGVRLSSLIQLNKNLYIQSGYQFSETGITNSDAINNPQFSRLIKDVNRSHSLFAEANLTVNEERTNIRAGLRGNYFSKINSSTLEPRLVINHKLSDTFSAEILGEVKSQTNVQVIDLQSDFLGVEKRRWLMSNGKDVPMLTSQQLSAGISYNKKTLLVSSDIFYKKVNGILTSSQGFQNQFQSVRASGNYDIIGLEILVNKKLNFGDFWVGYSLSESNYLFTDLIPPAFPNNLDIRHSLNGGVSAQIKQFEVSFGANWHTGRPTTNPVEGSEIVSGAINYEPPNSSRVPTYFRVDLSARWHFYYNSKLRSQAGISLWNLLNRENVLSRSYQINNSGEAMVVDQSGLSFTPNIFLRISFN